MRLPDVVESFDGIVPHVYRLSSPYSVSCYQDVKLTSVHRYVALLRLRLRLSSALHLHLCRLPLFGYYPSNIVYSKMFVGGLSWDTTDGTFSLIPIHLTAPFLQCHVHFTNFAELCGWCVILFIPEGLRNYFSEFGKVDACTIVRDADGKSRGFAFLTFEDPASVNAVMVREHFLDGKAVRVLHPSDVTHVSDNVRFVTDRP